MSWGNIDALWWLLSVPVVVGIYLVHLSWKARVKRRIATEFLRRRLIGQVSGRKQVLQFILVTCALAFTIVAVARPQWGEVPRKLSREGIDIVVALDISKSMLAADANPSRLRAAKDELIRVLSKLRGDRVGLVVFTGISFSQSPLTSDYSAIDFYLRKLDPNDMPVGGTASGRALRDSITLLTGEKVNGEKKDRRVKTGDFKRAKTQIIVLITDGEDHQTNPQAAAQLAKARGIRIYTIGFGSKKGEPIPNYDNAGNLRGYKKDRNGDVVYTKLNDEPLKEIASITGGQYYHYTGRGSVANSITRTLNALEKEELATLLRVKAQERFYIPLALALLCLIFATALGGRRGIYLGFWKQLARGRDPLNVLIPLALIPLSMMSQGCDVLHETLVVSEVGAVRTGNQMIAAGKPEDALAAYKKAEKTVPSTPELQFDMGIAYLESGDLEQAVSTLSRAVESSDQELRYNALFNLGIAYYRKEAWKESLETFKGALIIKPNELEAKLAYEVALYKVYPPCRALEDDSEDNDEPQAATPLQEPEKKDLTLCGGDDDWMGAAVYAGSLIRVKATFKRLREPEPGDPKLLPSPDQLRLSIFAQDGTTVLAVGALTPEVVKPGEPPKKKKKDEEASVVYTVGPIKLTAEMLRIPPPAGEETQVPVFIKVGADQPLEFKYDIEVVVIPPCFALEDAYEDNDTLAAAAQLKPEQNQPLHICRGDEEWFSYDVKAGDALFIDVVAGRDLETDTVPPLEVELLDATGTTTLSEVESVQTPAGPLWGVGLKDIAEDMTVKLRVRGVENEQQGPYELRLYHYPPCPTGDDRLEDNDQPETATDFPAQEVPVRHLRLCPGDPDYLKIVSQKEDKIALGIRYDDTPEDLDVDAPVTFRLLDESGSTVVVDGVRTEVAPPVQTPVNIVVTTEAFEEEKTHILEIASPVESPRFYDIVPMDGNKQQEQKQEQSESEDSDEDNE